MMRAAVAIAALLTGGLASAQARASFEAAQAAYAAGHYELAARGFFELASAAGESPVKHQAEYALVSALQKGGLPFTAFVYATSIVQAGPSHPFHAQAVETFVALQETLDDDYLIPSILNAVYDQHADAWARLPVEALSRINYLIGRIAYRKAQLEDARVFLEAVPSSSEFRARAQYMLGVTLADPRFPAADPAERQKNVASSVEIFERLLEIKPPQLDFAEISELTVLALGRTHYNLGEYAQAVRWYEKVPRFSRSWDQALFENGFARFQNDDLGGGLGSLQGLYAPQFAGAFQPEAWVLTATIYYFACLYEESKASLVEFEKVYLPMAEQLRALLQASDRPLTAYYRLVATPRSDAVPRPVLNWVRSNRRLLGLFTMLAQIEEEKKALGERRELVEAGLTAEAVPWLDQNRETLEQVAGNVARARLLEAQASLKTFIDQAEIIRFEIAKAETELAEAGVDPGQILAEQRLHRPAMPSERWNYWRFEGEFWRDEIGYYQYTLKRGCPAGR
jgi:tetratricopeptide (TPR) repeat protein